MDKGAIKRFAVPARNKLIEAVRQKAFELGITQKEVKEPQVYQDGFLINQKFYKKYEISQRNLLLREIEQKGLEQVIDEVAYTWFNRFIALRFMEVNDYLPTGVRIFSSIEPGKTEPDALTEVLMLVDDLDLDEQKVYELQDANDDEDLFKYILIKQCNKLGEIMPMMFEKIADYTELLLPNQLLSETSVIHDMVTMIDEADWTDEVEIIGWLYQYYISEKKDQVFAALRKNKKIAKENIPAATELFTPRWIVQYMVDNSLGHLWLESHPDDALQAKLLYYLEAAEQPEHVQEQLDALKDTNLMPESIKFFDPCMGSGHILVYAFEVFYQLYKSQGYREQDIPRLIIENNLYGVDIDPRAAQLAYFSVMMKARSYNHRIFNGPLHANLHWIEESNHLTEHDQEIFVGETGLLEDFTRLVQTFKDGKMYGSIIEVPEIDLNGLKQRVEDLKETPGDDMFAMDFKEHSLPIVERLVDEAIILAQKYDVVVTNPPYMGRKGMNAELAKYVKKHYKDSSADLYAVFMEVASQSVKENGFIGMVNQHSWMFLSSFEKLRKSMLKKHQIYSMAHLGPRAFPEIGGEVVQTTSFVMRKGVIKEYLATFVRLTDFNNAVEKSRQFYNKEFHYKRRQDVFSDIPSLPIAYWIPASIVKVYRGNTTLKDITISDGQTKTGNNDKYLRLVWEVNKNTINEKWFIHVKGGTFRRWSGNVEWLIDWSKEARDHYRKDRVARIIPDYLWYRPGVCWTMIGASSVKGFRYVKEGYTFNLAAPTLFFKDDNELFYSLGILNSKVGEYFINISNATMNLNVQDVRNIPLIFVNADIKSINKLIIDNIEISDMDWNNFETSIEFKQHPFLTYRKDSNELNQIFSNWSDISKGKFYQLKANEEELNRIFIDLYGLQDELTPEVEDKDVTVRRADKLRDVKSFISYAVGLMFGRYSLDKEGLAFAGGEFNLEQYQTFKPDADNVIPIADDVYFEDDIVTRFITILKAIFGQEHLEENLDFIADTLTKKGNETSRQRIRRYFLKEFYKDHVQTYQKRPIYWLFDSGKQDGFKALVYLHRYEPGLVARVRTDYLHAQQKKYEEEVERMDTLMASDVSKQEKTKAKKQKEKLQKQILECQSYDQVIAHVANQKLDLDLDDGVKVNYAKFQNIEIPQGEGKKPLKGNVLAKI